MDAKVKGGWTMNREKFSTATREVLDIAINHRRQQIKLPDGAIRGSRFNDDKAILARLESMFTEAEFMAYPGLKIDSALIDAAQADYWYEFEKEYDFPDCGESEDESEYE